MRRLLLWALVFAVVLFPLPAQAAEGCQSLTSLYDPGKTPEGFSADASDGCNRVHWTSSIGQGPGEGSITFKTIGNVDPWDSAYTLPSPAGGAAAYCRYRAAKDANGYFTNYFKVPEGTEVTVKYHCD